MRIYEEKQRFNQWWMLAINFSVIGILIYFMYEWYIAENAVDKVSSSDYAAQIAVILMLVLVVALLFLLGLKTTIDENGIQYQFTPFHKAKKTISWKEMDKCYTRKYKPILEYGGWGIKTVSKSNDMAYNVKGNMGIQLKLKSGKKLLIGTQKPEDAQIVINRYFNNEGI